MRIEEKDIEDAKPVTPQQVMEIYKKHGMPLTLAEAEAVLGFIQNFVTIAVGQALENHAGRGVQPINPN